MSNFLARAVYLLLAYAWFSGTAFAAATMPPQFNANSMTTGWVGEVEFTSFDFESNNECLIKADFKKADSTGNVFAIPVDKFGNLQLAASCWNNDFAESVNTQALDHANLRFIGTRKSDWTPIDFFYANLDINKQQKKLGDDKSGPAILNYIRGDRTDETPNGYKYRKRGDTVLGDIIHSRPLFVPHATAPRIYVGANDGMLHAIDACANCETNGMEAWAYIPSFLIPNLPLLTSTTSPYPHQYFVDATPNARKLPAALVGSGQSVLADQTILVGGVGAGATAAQSDGKLDNDPTKFKLSGIFALNITDATPVTNGTQVANKVLWEITNGSINNTASTSFNQLGFSYGIPAIVRMNDGNWAAVTGNGYSQADGGDGQAHLLIINLATGAKLADILATIGNAADDSHPNGLSTPSAVDFNNDGMVDYIYAGDLAGNMWKFNVRSTTPGSWSAFKLFSTPNANTITAQAITGAPAVALHPKGGYMVLFGTGRSFTNTGTNSASVLNDLTNTTQQYVYGLWDNDQPAGTTALSRTIDPTKLVSQTLSAPLTFNTSNSISNTVRTMGGTVIATPDYTPGTGQKQGWRLAVAVNATDSATTTANAERVLGDGGLVAASRFHVTLSNPNFDNGTTGGIANARGDNWLLEIDYLTGSAPATPIFDLTVDSVLDDSDLIPNTGQTDKKLRIPVARRIAKGGLMSQPVLAALEVNGQTYFNLNPDLAYATATTPTNPGIVNGHFDFDVYYNVCTPSSGGYSCKQHTHIHQYDDKFNVTGVDMQNASSTAYNLVNAIPSTATKFKVLVQNQRLSPSVNLMIGNTTSTYTPAINIQTSGWPLLGALTPTSFVSTLPTYSRGGVTGTTKLDKMYLKMPLFAFSQQDWPTYWANGGGTTCTATPNTWTAGGSLTNARKDHTATLLGSTGGVLVAGGSSGSAALSSAERYNATANTWSAAGTMGSARQYHAAVMLNDGKVLVTGGTNGSSSLNTAEIYDPVANTWSGAMNMNAARQYHTATLLANGKVLVTGGANGATVSNTAEVYDPATNVWTNTGTMVAARTYQAGTLLNDGRVLVSGGSTSTSASTSLNTTELYNPTTNTWAAGGNMTTARRYHSAVLMVGGKVLVAGGNSGSSAVNSAENYTPVANAAGSWASAGNMTSARQFHTAVLMVTNGKVLVAGGTTGSSVVNTADIYTPAATGTGAWAATTAMTNARDLQTATQLATGKVLVAGGYTSSAVMNSAEVYDPDTNCRVGLIPSQTGCITSNKYGFVDSVATGPYGNLWMNGALTIQVIKDTTPDSAIRLASTAGDPTFGYRLKSDTTSQANQLAEYTIFWHHPNGKCYSESGWGTTSTIAYPDSASSASAATKAPGSDDPTDGTFTGPGGGSGSGGEGGGGTPEGTPYTYTTADGQTYTQYVKTNADGSVTITIVGPDGTVIKTFPPGQGPVEVRKEIKSGRQSWKHLVRP